eukprot:GHVN01021297.1.p1 GENE.GHVN01021297.1~~GHVN01021297.1.p1  ORF type:complete len:102 (+),score=34.03 GHVN01021297.1:41-346(+)
MGFRGRLCLVVLGWCVLSEVRVVSVLSEASVLSVSVDRARGTNWSFLQRVLRPQRRSPLAYLTTAAGHTLQYRPYQLSHLSHLTDLNHLTDLTHPSQGGHT